MIKYIMFKTIQNYKKKGFTQAEILRKVKHSPKTVRKYYSMTAKEYTDYVEEISHREKLFIPYKEEILSVYEANGNKKLFKAAVYDYLEELFGKLPGTERTLGNFIDYLIETEELKISKSQRSYTPVEQLPFGKQLQIDFGETRTLCKKKVHIFAAVLSASRFKYCAVQEKPFKTVDVIQHLLDCFQYIGGRPEQLVIDQDKTLVIKENYGDIIYTEKFQDFITEMNLDMFVCRKSDPETKGKIENLIKFVKQNFFSIRRFESFNEICESLQKWIIRRANGKISTATKRIPAEMIQLEREKLRTLKNSIHQKDNFIEREDRKVDECCFLFVKASKYEVPDFYRNKWVEIYQTEFKLFVYDKKKGDLIIEHQLSPIPGKTIYSNKSSKDRQKRKQELITELESWFSIDCWPNFIKLCFDKYSRYFRDQYYFARNNCKQIVDYQIMTEALQYCLDNENYSMSCLFDTYKYFKRIQNTTEEPLKETGSLLKENISYPELEIAESDFSLYKNYLQEVSQ